MERYANLKLLVDYHLLRSWVSGKVGVSSHSQSHELQQLKWHPWSKDHVLAFSGQNSNYEAVVTREEKRMFCTNVPMRPLELDLHNSCFVFFFYKLTQKHPWLMTSLDACLVSYFCSHQKCCQFVLYWWTDLIHKKKRYQKMPPCLAVPCGNSRGKIPSIISIPQCLQVSSSALRISKSHPWYGLDIFWKWKMRWTWMRCTVYLS